MASEVIKSMSPLVVVWEIVEWEPRLLGYMWSVFSVVEESREPIIVDDDISLLCSA